MLLLLLDPIVLMILIWLVARNTTELEFPTAFFVSLGIGVASALIAGFFEPMLGPFAILPALAVAVFILMRFCYTTLAQSVIILALLAVWHIAFSYVWTSVAT